MTQNLMPGILALLMILLPIPVLAEGPYNLSFSSATEDDGYIIAALEITPDIPDSDSSGYVSFWFIPNGTDCLTARPLGWQYVPLHHDPHKVIMKAAVPYSVIAGTYSISAIFVPGDLIPTACDTGPSATTSVTISTPGEGTHDMAGSLPGGAADASSPDYRIEAISGIDTTIRVAPGASVKPVVTITNTGTDDPSGKPVEVHAYLGSDELIPVTATIQPMKAGDTETVDLSYLIPDTIPLRSYPFYLIVDPQGDHGTPDAGTNLKRTGGQLSVRVEAPDLGCGCK